MQQAGRQGGQPPPPQILADQLTLCQPGGTHYSHPVLPAPPDFWPLLHACAYIQNLDIVHLWQGHQNVKNLSENNPTH